MRVERHDICPQLVALYFADDQNGLSDILRYGDAYLAAYCHRNGELLSRDCRRTAVAHALMRLWMPVRAGTTDKRAKEAGTRASTFRWVSNLMLEVYKRRLTEGATRFIETALGSEEPGRPGTVTNPMKETQWWKHTGDSSVLMLHGDDAERYMSGRPAQPRLVRLKEWIDRRPPIRRPPVLAPDKDQHSDIQPVHWGDVLRNSDEFRFEDAHVDVGRAA